MGATYLSFEGVNFFFDLVSSDEAKHTALATSHPVEEGSDVTDNIQAQAKEFTIQILVTNTPIQDVNAIYGGGFTQVALKIPTLDKPIYPTPGSLENAAIGAITSAITGPSQPSAATVLTFPSKFNAVKDTTDLLTDWLERGVLGTVVTPYRKYDNMAIVGVTISRDATTGDAANVTLDFKEIRIVTAKLVTAPIPTEIRGILAKHKGEQPAVQIPPDSPKQTLAHALLSSALSGAVGSSLASGGI